MSTSVAAVARIAYFTSDVVVDSLPKSNGQPSFSSEYQALERKAIHRPKLVSVPNAADPASYILHHKSTGLLSYSARSQKSLLSQLLPNLNEVASSAVVFHIAVQGDLSDALALRSAVPYFLVSNTLTQAHDNALVAARLASEQRRVVVHAFQVDVEEESIPELAEDDIRGFLSGSGRSSPLTNG